MEVAEILALRYPFGREHEVSVQLMFRDFSNNLFLGQFELARASLGELNKNKTMLSNSVVGILENLIEKSIPM